MKEKLNNYLKNKKIVLLGLARSNLAIVKILEYFNIPFSICDKSKMINENIISKKDSVKFYLGDDYMDFLDSDLIFRSPGIPYFCESLINARKKGVEISSEIELFMKFCPCPIIGITGSDGKTTVTVIISEIFKKMNLEIFSGGNIGNPLMSEIFNIKENSVSIVELSSFQLISFKKSPDISVITNISPNHLDIHKDFKEYQDAKKNIFKFQNKDSILVINYDDKPTCDWCDEANSKIIFFTVEKKFISKKCEAFLYIENDVIFFYYKNQVINILNKKDIKISGKHNLKNYMAAICTVFGYYIRENVFDNYLKKIKKSINLVAKEFFGVEHRIEFVREYAGVKYYNDSIATTPSRTISGTLDVFYKNIILICGGYDKKLDYTELASAICGVEFNCKRYIPKVKLLILMGQTSKSIENAVRKIKNNFKILNVNSMDEAVEKARNLSDLEDIVVLSPASASFDSYNNFEERGNHFKRIVNNLI